MRRSYSPQGSDRRRLVRVGVFNDFAIVRPVGALDGKVGAGQVAAEDSRGLVDDLCGLSHNVGIFRQGQDKGTSEFFCASNGGWK